MEIGPHLKFHLVFVCTNCISSNIWHNQLVSNLCLTAVNCTDEPIDVPGNDKGEFDWDSENKKFGSVVTYKCPKKGWGFPANGLSETLNECQADKSWTVTEIETCLGKLYVVTFNSCMHVSTDSSFRPALSRSTSTIYTWWLVLVWT
jgi:hypothetical protein